MFELRRLTKTVKQYVYFFQNELNRLYEANINLYVIEPVFLFKPFVFIIMKLLEKMMDTKSKNILLVKRYQKYFRDFLENLKKMKYLCDL